MAITYDWYENPVSGEEKVQSEGKELHPRLFLNGKIDVDQLYQKVHERSSLSVGDVKNVMDTLAALLAEELREGRSVHLEGVGYLAPVLKSTEKVTRLTKNKWNKVALKTISFRPDAVLRKHLQHVCIRQHRETNHSGCLSWEMIDECLTDYFRTHDLLTRIDFQQLCAFTCTTANRHLRRLQEEGKLRNVGRVKQPMYVAVSGCYGVSEESAVRYRE